MATQRKNKPPAPSVMEVAVNDKSSPSKIAMKSPRPLSSAVTVATVNRRRCGTGPFDHFWLNLDCCGLFCAALTYGLHLYGCYAVCQVLLPPWMSYIYDPDGSIVSPTSPVVDGAVRKLSFWGWFHCLAFTGVAAMAVYSHFKAMTTDPGAVPPDAAPLPHPDEVASLLESGEAAASNAGGGASAAVASGHGTNGTGTSAASVAAGAAAAVVGGAAAVAAAPVLAAGAAVASTLPQQPKSPTQQTKPVMKPPQPRGKRICRRCNAYKPKRAHHCSVCKRCIIKMDHHCPWVNNCVGIGNHKYFLLFVFYTFLSCTYSLTLVVTRFVSCLGNHSRLARAHCLDEPTHILNLVGLIVEALLFGLFTCCMMVDQWDVVMTNVTHIDRLKGETGFGFLDDTAQRMLGINEVFGSGRAAAAAAASNSERQQMGGGMSGSHFRPDWLSPFVNVCFPASVHDEIMGFCRPCGGKSMSRSKKEDDDDDIELRSGRGPATIV